MNEKLQQAIAATRNGQTKEAQLLLTQILKEDPNQTHAWFLLSHLVDEKQKKIAYLHKVLALDPDHDKARQMLARLEGAKAKPAAVEMETAVAPPETPPEPAPPTPEPLPISEKPTDFLSQEMAETVPEWLVEEEGEIAAAPVAAQAKTQAGEQGLEMPEVPDWLQEEVSLEETGELAAETRETAVSQPVLKRAAVKEAEETAPDSELLAQQARLTRILYILITFAAIIAVLLGYLILTS